MHCKIHDYDNGIIFLKVIYATNCSARQYYSPEILNNGVLQVEEFLLWWRDNYTIVLSSPREVLTWWNDNFILAGFDLMFVTDLSSDQSKKERFKALALCILWV